MSDDALDEHVTKPWWKVVGPDEGESLWQPQPADGYVTLKLTPENMPYDGYTSGIQVLPPGCHVKEHGHRRNHELLFIYEGTGKCVIEDQVYDLKPETTVLFGRYASHLLENTGDTDMKLFWVFFPPSLEHWFRAIGQPRQPGDEAPASFPRPDDVQDVMEMLRFIPPKR